MEYRDVTYDLSITGPGMRPIELNEVGPTTGSVRVEVPAGPDRLIDMRARNDIYSGSTTRTLRAGRTENVRLQLLPGPVFVSHGGGSLDLPQSLVQLRDLSINLDEPANTLRVSEGVSRDAQFASDGTLWYLRREAGTTDDFLIGVSEFGQDSPYTYAVELPDPVGSPLWVALSVDILSQQFAVGSSNGDLAVGDINESAVVDTLDIQGDFDLFDVSGMAFGSGETMFVVAEIDDPEVFFGVALVKIDLTGSQPAEYVALPHDQTVPVYSGFPNKPAWGDLRIIDGEVIVISARAGNGNSAAYRYSTDLELLEQFGTTTTDSNPEEGQFWGPRRFVATRDETELIVIDQKDDDNEDDPDFGDPDLDGSGRLVRFNFGTHNGWQTFGEDEFGFFDTFFC